MGRTRIKEIVEVAAVFDPAARPVKFRWNGRVYPVEEVTFKWSSTDGETRRIHYSVHDGATLFELSYDTVAMRWTLEGVEP